MDLGVEFISAPGFVVIRNLLRHSPQVGSTFVHDRIFRVSESFDVTNFDLVTLNIIFNYSSLSYSLGLKSRCSAYSPC